MGTLPAATILPLEDVQVFHRLQQTQFLLFQGVLSVGLEIAQVLDLFLLVCLLK